MYPIQHFYARMPLSSFSSVTAEKNSPLERSRGRIHLIGGDFYYSPNSRRDRALWLVPLGVQLIPGGRYTHLAWLRTASDTVSSLGTDP